MKKSFADILKEDMLALGRRLEAKVPQWAGVPGLEVPTRLCTEQCSSAPTARYKAAVAAALAASLRQEQPGEPARLADLTGGLGVDSWFFAQEGFTVCCNEMNPELAQAAEHNFAALRAAGRGGGEITVSSVEVTPENIGEILGSMAPDIVYMDPARRSQSGGKVFRIADCTPNALGMTDVILEKAPVLMLKLSPMADISGVVRELDSCSGGKVTQVHIVGAAGECKELLVVMERGAGEGTQPRITVASEDHIFSFSPADETVAKAEYVNSSDGLKLLFEPGSALMKSGAYKLISERFGLRKLSRDVHLYCAAAPECNNACGSPSMEQTHQRHGLPENSLEGLGKWFEVTEVLPLGKAAFRELAGRSLRAEVTARGLHVSSDDLRKRMSIKSSDPEGLLHIFGVNLGPLGDHIIVTRRLK